MIVQERYTIDGIDYIRTYSDADRYVVGGNPQGAYAEANDRADLNRQYVEGEPMRDEDLAAQAEEVLNILMGVDE